MIYIQGFKITMDNKLITTPTSLMDLNDITGLPIPMITYTDLKHVKKLTDLVHPTSPAIYILIDFNRDDGQISGHWTLLSLFDEQNEDGQVEYSLSYFDSYGKPVDGEMNRIPKEYIRKYYKSKDVLTKLVKQSAKQELNIKYIDYNSHKYQLDYTSVCGRYCAYFLICAIKHGVSTDVFDTETFYDILKKNMDEYRQEYNINGKIEWDELILWLTQ